MTPLGFPAPLFEVINPDGQHRFLVVRSRQGQLRLVERDATRVHGRVVRIAAHELEVLRSLTDAERFEGAAKLYHEKRKARKARQFGRECGGAHESREGSE